MFHFDSEAEKNDASVMDVVFIFIIRVISITRPFHEIEGTNLHSAKLIDSEAEESTDKSKDISRGRRHLGNIHVVTVITSKTVASSFTVCSEAEKSDPL